jgi:hypothetical protein
MKSRLLLVLTFITYFSIGQDKKDNYSFFKLYATNDKEEVLLVKWEGQWEIAGNRYNESMSIREFLNTMAADMGVKIDDPKVCALYTQKWRGSNPPTIMHYYKAKYVGGELKVPSDCTEIKWFTFDDALKIIPYPIMTSIMKEIKNNPGKIIGGAFERYKDSNNVTQYTTLENFYIMN